MRVRIPYDEIEMVVEAGVGAVAEARRRWGRCRTMRLRGRRGVLVKMKSPRGLRKVGCYFIGSDEPETLAEFLRGKAGA